MTQDVMIKKIEAKINQMVISEKWEELTYYIHTIQRKESEDKNLLEYLMMCEIQALGKLKKYEDMKIISDFMPQVINNLEGYKPRARQYVILDKMVSAIEEIGDVCETRKVYKKKIMCERLVGKGSREDIYISKLVDLLEKEDRHNEILYWVNEITEDYWNKKEKTYINYLIKQDRLDEALVYIEKLEGEVKKAVMYLKPAIYLFLKRYDDVLKMIDEKVDLDWYGQNTIYPMLEMKSYYAKENSKQVKKCLFRDMEKDKEIMPYHLSCNPYIMEKIKKRKAEIYHYTGIEALRGIIDNKQIWVTKSDFLNDTMELNVVKSIVAQINAHLEEVQDNNFKTYISILYSILSDSWSNGVESEWGFTKEDLNKLKEEVLYYLEDEVYIFSASINRDNLILWNNYSNSDGYNIAFDKEKLINKIEEVAKENRVKEEKDEELAFTILEGEVVYEEVNIGERNYKDSMIYQVIEEIYRDGKEYNISNKKIIEIALSTLTLLGIFIKHKGIQQEEEYRIAFALHKDGKNEEKYPKFKTKLGAFIPYVPISLGADREIIKEITIGPLNNLDIAEKGLMQYLRQKKIKDVEKIIKKSSIPLRYK